MIVAESIYRPTYSLDEHYYICECGKFVYFDFKLKKGINKITCPNCKNVTTYYHISTESWR